uniref:Uncharacterized protein n=1 Tax=Castor canadensis TaxID=51338 RepID=A0A8C0X674_CASCN
MLGESLDVLLRFSEFSFLNIGILLRNDLHIFSMSGKGGRSGTSLYAAESQWACSSPFLSNT